MKRKVVIIGLDGASLDVIKFLSKKGLLPHISKFFEEGVYGELKSTYPPITPAAWASFMTGKNPGKHGVYDFMTKIPGMYVWEPTNIQINNTIWHTLSQANKKVSVINVPMTYPPSKINGILISGLGTPSDNSVFTYPDEFKTVLMNNKYIIDIDWIPYFRKDKKVEKLIEDLITMTKKRYEIIYSIIKNQDWDFLAMVFVGTDRIQHCLWDSIFDEKSEWHELVCRYYRYLDNIIGNILSEIGDSDVIIMSDHGFGPFRYRINLNDWLHSIGLLTFKDSNKKIIHKIVQTMAKAGINRKNINAIFRLLGKDVDIGKLKPDLTPFASVINFKQTKAFSYCLNSIYINKKGREIEGIVEDNEYEDLRTLIAGQLCKLTDPETGEKIIYKVSKKEEIYHGDKMEVLPDLIITEYDERFTFSGYSTGRNKTRCIFESLESHSGDHKLNGIFMAKGQSFKEGIEVKNAEIIDICPTVLAMFGIKPDEDIDGRVLKEALGSKLQTKLEIKTGFINEEKKELSQEDKQNIIERLKGLGYL